MLFAVAGALVSITASVARGDNSPEAHMKILTSAQSKGVAVLLNQPHCVTPWAKGVRGFYVPSIPALVLCQENTVGDSSVLDLTDEDLYTIRHEGHHLVQDCVSGLGDGKLVNMFPDNNEGGDMGLEEFIKTSGLSNTQIENIISKTKERGGDDNTVRLELEASSVAQSIDASDISGAVEDYCSTVLLD